MSSQGRGKQLEKPSDQDYPLFENDNATSSMAVGIVDQTSGIEASKTSSVDVTCILISR